MKVYKVGFGASYKGGYDKNVATYNVLANNAIEAISKAEAEKAKIVSDIETEEEYKTELENVSLVLVLDI